MTSSEMNIISESEENASDSSDECVSPAFFLSYTGHSIEFYLDLEKEEEKNNLTNIINANGGTCIEKVEDISPWTVVMVDDPFSYTTKRPLFSKRYITECMKQRRVLDITDYAHRIHPTIKRSMMDIIFWRKIHFPNLEAADHPKHASTFNSKLRDIEVEFTSCSEATSSPRTKSFSATIGKSLPPSEPDSSLKQMCCPTKIPTPVLHSSNLSSMPHSSATHPASAPSRKQTPISPLKPRPSVVDGSDSEDEFIPGTITKLHSSPSKVMKSTRAAYTMGEKEEILKFLIKHDHYSSLKGDRVWKTMEARGICPRRTYQSLKQHFSKVIINELDRYHFLTNEQKNAFRKGFFH